jgi:hypothetical protein
MDAKMAPVPSGMDVWFWIPLAALASLPAVTTSTDAATTAIRSKVAIDALPQ